MSHFLRKLALLMLIAGLPLQGLHAAAMPVCGQDKEEAAVHPQFAQEGDVVAHDHNDQSHASSDADTACDGCSTCQACSAPAVASTAIDVSLTPEQTPPPALAIHPSLFVPEQLRRPPRAVLASRARSALSAPSARHCGVPAVPESLLAFMRLCARGVMHVQPRLRGPR